MKDLEKAVVSVLLGEKKVLTAKQQQVDVHEPEKDELTSKDFEMLRAGKKTKPMKEEQVAEIAPMVAAASNVLGRALQTKVGRAAAGAVADKVIDKAAEKLTQKEEVEAVTEKFEVGSKVVAKSDVQGLKKGEKYEVTGHEESPSPAGSVVTHILNNKHKVTNAGFVLRKEETELDEVSKDTVRNYKMGVLKKLKTGEEDKNPSGTIKGLSMANKRLSGKVPTSEETQNEEQVDEARFKKGQDIGKPGKNFAKIAKSAAKRYGSKEAGMRVAGAVLKKVLAKEEYTEDELQLIEAAINDHWDVMIEAAQERPLTVEIHTFEKYLKAAIDTYGVEEAVEIANEAYEKYRKEQSLSSDNKA